MILRIYKILTKIWERSLTQSMIYIIWWWLGFYVAIKEVFCCDVEQFQGFIIKWGGEQVVINYRLITYSTILPTWIPRDKGAHLKACLGTVSYSFQWRGSCCTRNRVSRLQRYCSEQSRHGMPTCLVTSEASFVLLISGNIQLFTQEALNA